MSLPVAPPLPAAVAAAAESASPPEPWLREAVRDVLAKTPAYARMAADDRRALAQAMVRVSSLAADCVRAEALAEAEIRRPAVRALEAAPAPPVRALDDQPGFGAATHSIGQTTRDTLAAISFPRFVTDLINGVFRAMTDSSQQQMNQYLQLLNAVSGTAAGFAATQGNDAQAMQWVVDHFPEQIELELPDPPDPGDPPPDPEDVEPPRLRLVAGAHMPEADAIRTALGLAPTEEVSAANPQALVPFARRALARQRQQMLATMVLMGMSRIVIDEGRINAAMRFHIDTRSAAANDHSSQFGMQNRVKAGGSFGIGAWGASAEVENTISYVNTDRSQRSEEINTSADLTSSVELHFHTDAVPLNRLAAQAQADRVRSASLNPGVEIEQAAIAERTARRDSQRQGEESRRTAMGTPAGGVAQPTLGNDPLPPVPAPHATDPPAASPPAASPPPPGPPPAAPPPPAPAPPAASPPAAHGGGAHAHH
jgi:hypothetical protein